MNIDTTGNISQIISKTTTQVQPNPAPPASGIPPDSTVIQQDSNMTGGSLDKAVAILNEQIQKFDTSLSFSMDKSTGLRVVTVTDTQTNEVIRQIPSEEALALTRAIDTLQGLIIRRKA